MAGRDTLTGVGGGVIAAAGTWPFVVGLREVPAHTSIWSNNWIVLGTVLWIVGLVILVGTGIHLTYEWLVVKRRKKGGRYTPPKPGGDTYVFDHGGKAPGAGGGGGPAIGPGAIGGQGGEGGSYSVLKDVHLNEGEVLDIHVGTGGMPSADADDTWVKFPDGRILRAKGGKTGDPGNTPLPGGPGADGLVVISWTEDPPTAPPRGEEEP
jgi:hypothetical protein